MRLDPQPYDKETLDLFAQTLIDELGEDLATRPWPDPRRPSSVPIPEPERGAAVAWFLRASASACLQWRDLEEKNPGPAIRGQPMWANLASGLASIAARNVRAIVLDGSLPAEPWLAWWGHQPEVIR